jgi:acyl carrier protein
MSIAQLVSLIESMVHDALMQKGLPPQPVCGETMLLGSPLGIDSLDLAAIVVRLSEQTGRDPFQDGFVDFRTVGDLAQLYAAS